MARHRLYPVAVHLGLIRGGALTVPSAPQVDGGDQPEQRPQVPEMQHLIEHRGDKHADDGGAEQLGPGKDAGVAGPQAPGRDPPAPGENDDEQAYEGHRAQQAAFDQ